MSRRRLGAVEREVLLESRRRCCICFGLNRDTSLKVGQLAHLDQNPTNSRKDNVAYLCLDHHALYDSSSRQAKGLTLGEVKHFRSELYEALRLAFDQPVQFGYANSASLDPAVGHFIRAGAETDSSEIHIEATESGGYHVWGLALHGLDRPRGPNLGELDFYAEIDEGKFEFDSNGYRATFSLTGDALHVSESDPTGHFGMGVFFAGRYLRASREVDEN